MKLNEAITSATLISGLTCPNCGSLDYRKHGHSKSIQRYLCKKCERSFNETINTPLHGIHDKDKMVKYITALTEQKTIRSAAAALGISVNTSFCWRHKLLASLHSIPLQSAQTPAGVCQINIPHSFKGKREVPDKTPKASRTFMVTDAYGIPCLQQLPAHCTALGAAKILRMAVSLAPNAAIVPTQLLTRATRFVQYQRTVHTTSKKILLERVRETAGKISLWMANFHGVATKYLQQYWNWFRVQKSALTVRQFASECLSHRHLKHYRQLISQ